MLSEVGCIRDEDKIEEEGRLMNNRLTNQGATPVLGRGYINEAGAIQNPHPSFCDDPEASLPNHHTGKSEIHHESCRTNKEPT